MTDCKPGRMLTIHNILDETIDDLESLTTVVQASVGYGPEERLRVWGNASTRGAHSRGDGREEEDYIRLLLGQPSLARILYSTYGRLLSNETRGLSKYDRDNSEIINDAIKRHTTINRAPEVGTLESAVYGRTD